MLFHVGALRRLFEIGALRAVKRVSSVSGASIAAAVLGIKWEELMAQPGDVAVFEEKVQQPLFDFAGKRLDVPSGVLGLITPGRSIAQTLAKAYGRFLGHATLEHLPNEPRFVFCATNLGSGALVRFSKSYTADYRIGKRSNLVLPLGDVVAASAAFPPMLSPMVIKLRQDQRLSEHFPPKPGEEPSPLKDTEPYVSRLELSDGGVYDNLGLQPVEQFHTILASDGGGPFEYEPSVPVNWLEHMVRAWKVTDNQVRSLRRSNLVEEYEANQRNGVYWGIQTTYSDYEKREIFVHDGWAEVVVPQNVVRREM
jgi:NTE family protein